jgi:hypothetical protein
MEEPAQSSNGLANETILTYQVYVTPIIATATKDAVTSSVT